MSNAAPRGGVVGTVAESAGSAATDDFTAVAGRESQRLFGLAFTILRDGAGAEDAVQETLLRAWRSWGQLRNPAARRAWLTQVCVRQAHNARSRHRHRGWLPLSDAVADPTAAAGGVGASAGMAGLSPDQRAIVALHFGHGYTLDECADLVGCAPGTARSRLGRALATLRKEAGNE